eukprot:37913-Rhodomonas_salina.3
MSTLARSIMLSDSSHSSSCQFSTDDCGPDTAWISIPDIAYASWHRQQRCSLLKSQWCWEQKVGWYRQREPGRVCDHLVLGDRDARRTSRCLHADTGDRIGTV